MFHGYRRNMGEYESVRYRTAAPPRQTESKQAAPAPPDQPFRVGVFTTEDNDYDQTLTMTAALQQYPTYTVTPNGWSRGFWFLITAATAGNAATTAFAADAPANAVFQIKLTDVGGREIFGPLGGYDWLTVVKLGAYQNIGDPRADPVFSVTAGAGGTGGSFTMCLYLPLEVVQRDALGAVENKSSSSTFKIYVTLNTGASVYTTAPTTLPPVRIRILSDGYTEPDTLDAMGRPLAQGPPAAGSVQYWTNENLAENAGNFTYNITTGLGYPIRMIIVKILDGSNTRSGGDTNWPDPATFKLGKVQLFQRYKQFWISRMSKMYGFFPKDVNGQTVTVDGALTRENGVFPIWFNQDFDLMPGSELRNGYLVTKTGNVLQLTGSLGGSGTVFMTVNYVIPVNKDAASLRAGK
jgi:hypothetical protein